MLPTPKHWKMDMSNNILYTLVQIIYFRHSQWVIHESFLILILYKGIYIYVVSKCVQ